MIRNSFIPVALTVALLPVTCAIAGQQIQKLDVQESSQAD